MFRDHIHRGLDAQPWAEAIEADLAALEQLPTAPTAEIEERADEMVSLADAQRIAAERGGKCLTAERFETITTMRETITTMLDESQIEEKR